MQHASFHLRVPTATPDHRTRVLNVGCGPSFDVRLALRQVAEPLDAEILLVDLDPLALAFSERHLAAQEHVRIHYRESDVVALVRQLASARPTPRFDAILFGGLFDYVPDDAVAFVLRRAVKLLAPGRLNPVLAGLDDESRTDRDGVVLRLAAAGAGRGPRATARGGRRASMKRMRCSGARGTA